ncbi:hypothetical protein K438DRAFT_1962395 [Mycena galopus ATCC 62051]|nr:hypothetical protein K438DRAFT_1962395 [Mycena galopus ATCC 62051]
MSDVCSMRPIKIVDDTPTGLSAEARNAKDRNWVNTSRTAPSTGGLPSFGKIGSNKGTFGPSSVFSSNSNIFSILSRPADETGPEAPPQRRWLILQPRWKPAEEEGTAPAEAMPVGSTENSEDEGGAAPQMTEQAADEKIAEDSKEFFAIRDLDKAEVYFSAMPAVH